MQTCYQNLQSLPGVSGVICKAVGLTGNLELFTQATTFNYVTMQPEIINAEILFLICPLVQTFETLRNSDSGLGSGAYCNISLPKHNIFPFSQTIPYYSSSASSSLSESDDCQEEEELEATIEMMEIRIHLDNFSNSALDYDPEIFVLFDGGSRSGSGCGSDAYELKKDVVFWLSVSAAV